MRGDRRDLVAATDAERAQHVADARDVRPELAVGEPFVLEYDGSGVGPIAGVVCDQRREFEHVLPSSGLHLASAHVPCLRADGATAPVQCVFRAAVRKIGHVGAKINDRVVSTCIKTPDDTV